MPDTISPNHTFAKINVEDLNIYEVTTKSLGKSDRGKGEVLGKDGRVLTASEMEKEKPLFENAVLVDIGDKHLFYNDYIAGGTSSFSFEETRLCTQTSLIGYFVPRGGDVLVLQTLWNQVSIAANHKETSHLLTGEQQH